jgi:HSP20 family protein
MASQTSSKNEAQAAVPVKRGGAATSLRPVSWDLDRMFDQVSQGMFPSLFGQRMRDFDPFRGFEAPSGASGLLSPRVDLTESDGSYEISAELPGLDEKNVEVVVDNDMLTIRGEKSEEHSEKEKNYHLTERRYGAFQRCFRLPGNVDARRIRADFDKGVLKIDLPKTAESKPKKIAIGKP